MARSESLVSAAFLASSIGVPLLGACAEDMTHEERTFRQIVVPLIRIEKSLLKVIRKELKAKRSVRRRDSAAIFLAKHRPTLMRTAQELQEFIENYPQGKWTDDASLCLAKEYVMMASIDPSDTMAARESIRAMRYYFDKYPEAKIEEWTANRVPAIKLFTTVPYPPNVTLEAWIEESLYINMIYAKFLLEGISGAEGEYKKMKQAQVREGVLEMIRRFLDSLQENSDYWERLVPHE